MIMSKNISNQPKYDFFKRIYFAIYKHFINSKPDNDGFGVNMLKYTLSIPFGVRLDLNEKPELDILDYAFIFFNPFKEDNHYLFIIDMGMVVEFIDGRINVLFYEPPTIPQYTNDELIAATKKLLQSIISIDARVPINISELNTLEANVSLKSKGLNSQSDLEQHQQYLKELALKNLKSVSQYAYLNSFASIARVYDDCLDQRIKSLLKNKTINNSGKVLKDVLELENCDPALTQYVKADNLIKYGVLEPFFYNDKMIINSTQLELDIPDFEDGVYFIKVSETTFNKKRLDELNVDYIDIGNKIKNQALDVDFTYPRSEWLNDSYRFKKANITPVNTFFIPFVNPSPPNILGYILDENHIKDLHSISGAVLNTKREITDLKYILHSKESDIERNMIKLGSLFCVDPPEHFNSDVGIYPVIGLQFAKKYQKMLQDRFDDSLIRFIERVETESFISEQEFLNKMRDIYQLLHSRNELKKQFENEQVEYFRELANLMFSNDEVI